MNRELITALVDGLRPRRCGTRRWWLAGPDSGSRFALPHRRHIGASALIPPELTHRMYRVYPTPAAEIDPRDAYLVSDTPYVRANMVSSVDGAAAVAGRVGALTGSADQAVLHALRGLADVVLVGASTIRAEGYGPSLLPMEHQQRRAAEGVAPSPRLAIVTGSLDLDLNAPLFTESASQPLVLTASSAPAKLRARADEVAEVVQIGADRVDLAAAVAALVARGLRRILCEGGAHLLAQLYAADQVDELCLTISPRVTCGRELRITSGPPLVSPRDLRLAHVLEQDGFVFLRYSCFGARRVEQGAS